MFGLKKRAYFAGDPYYNVFIMDNNYKVLGSYMFANTCSKTTEIAVVIVQTEMYCILFCIYM